MTVNIRFFVLCGWSDFFVILGGYATTFYGSWSVLLMKLASGGVRLVGWLFWVKWPFETVFQSILGRLPERGGKR